MNISVKVGIQTVIMTCDSCNATSEVAFTRTVASDILLPTPQGWVQSHRGARNPRIKLRRWTINGNQQCAATK